MIGRCKKIKKKVKVKEINKKISSYGSDYNKNIAEVKIEHEFDIIQLDGMEDGLLNNRLIEGTEKYRVKLQYQDYIPIIEY
jgi:Zn-dependent oligopeptidase